MLGVVRQYAAGARHTGSVCRAPRLGGDAYFSVLAYSLALSGGM